MKSKIIGLVILLAVIIGVGLYTVYTNHATVTELHGYLGGEKIGLYDDEAFQKIIRDKYGLDFSYLKAGSLDMITADKTGMDYLFPSSQTALDLYKREIGNPKKSEIIFNTPIVLYSYRLVADALVKEGLVTVTDGVYSVDMAKLVSYIAEGKKWSDVGLNQLYGPLLVSTTDPTKSNSGMMFFGLVANILNNGSVVDSSTVNAVLPAVKAFFTKLGFMETSSADLFEQYLKTGVGAKPLVALYESQILEFAVENPGDWAQLKDDIVMIYPEPTVWSTHTYIALDDNGALGINALLDPDVQKLAWEKHGFRTGVYSIASDVDFSVPGISKSITKVVAMPDSGTMDTIIKALTH